MCVGYALYCKHKNWNNNSMEKYYEKNILNAYSRCTFFITRNCNQYGKFYKQQGEKDEHTNNQLWKK